VVAAVAELLQLFDHARRVGVDEPANVPHMEPEIGLAIAVVGRHVLDLVRILSEQVSRVDLDQVADV
jgi:hypothetical protein